MTRTFLTLLIAATALGAAADEPEFLPVEEAFRYSAEATGDVITVRWDVEPGYYLYRKRFGFESLTPGITLGEPLIPDGEQHEDEFFGLVETYRDRFEIVVPMIRGDAAGETMELELRMQGCADAGLCYPPQKWTTQVALPASGGGAISRSGLLDLLNEGASGQGEFLPVDEAFQLSATVLQPGWVEAHFRIADGYYLYRDKLAFDVTDAPAALGEPQIPAGELKNDEFFGDVSVFYEEAAIRLPVGVDGEFELAVDFQGCAEDGICYPPTKRTLSLDMASAGVAQAALFPDTTTDEGAASGGTAGGSESDRLAGMITSSSLWFMAATFFGFGLLLAFTPCVLPMVPILSSLIVGQGSDLGARRAFSLSLAYVLAMALTYTVAGVVVAMLGQNLQAAFQHPIIIGTFAGIFVLLSLSMFGFYELQVPAGLQTKLTEMSNRQQGGTLWGAGIMGMLSALIVGPCVAAPLAAALIVIGQTGDELRGGVALFSLSLGMGTPLLVFGASAGKILPTVGPWMNAVKGAFGVLLLAVAVWMLDRIVPSVVTLALWAVLIFMTGVFLGAFDPLGENAGRGRRFAKGVGLLGVIYGGLMLVGAAAGGSNPLMPLAGVLQAPAGEASARLEFRMIKTTADLDRELQLAAAEGRPAMLDFYADWCVDCKRMERSTFRDDKVLAALEGVRLLKADVTANDAEDRALLKRFGIFGPPTIAFFPPGEGELKRWRQVGYAPADEFAAHVESAIGRTGGASP